MFLSKNKSLALLLAGTLFGGLCGAYAAGDFNVGFVSMDGWQTAAGDVPDNGKNIDLPHRLGQRSMPQIKTDNAWAHLTMGDSVTLYQTDSLQPGFYDVTAVISSPSATGNCYVFGKGTGYSMASTLATKVAYSIEKDTVYVRGVGTTDGRLTVGLFNDGRQDVYVQQVTVKKAKACNYLQGGDITELNYVLDAGGQYKDAGGKVLTSANASREENAQSVLRYLSANGFNFARIRLTNNPGPSNADNTNTYYLPNGYQDESDCLQLAKMAQEAGMQIQFTFNWSDFWSNGSRQNVPADWLQAIAGQTNTDSIVAILSRCAYSYTRKVMAHLASLGIYPAYVSLGNETNGGFLFPYGYSYDVPTADATKDMPAGKANWKAIAAFINAGYAAVKEVSPNSRVVIHLADQTYDAINPDKKGHVDYYVYSWYFDKLKAYGARYDVIGASYYPSWSTATAKEAAAYFKQLMARYGKDVLVMETGYNWTAKRKDGYDGQLPYTAEKYKVLFPFDTTGQKGFMAQVLNEQKGCTYGSNQVLGDLYWDPMMIHVEDASGKSVTGWANLVSTGKADVNVVENTTFFDFGGKALPVLDAYRYNRNSVALSRHKVNVMQRLGGTLGVSAAEAYYGDSVSVKISAANGYRLDSCRLSWAGLSVLLGSSSSSITFEVPDSDVELTPYWSVVGNTGCGEVAAEADGLQVEPEPRGLRLCSAVGGRVAVYDAAGRMVAQPVLPVGESVIVPLSAGCYVVGGQKVLVR
jgi:arabinogalactan endo-1,4-beta-galactosidase